MNRTAMGYLGLWLVGVGCSDPHVTLQFDIPEAYEEMVDQVELRILVPSSARPFSCDDIAFGRADPAVVRLSEVGSVTLGEDVDETLLVDILREGEKRFVAEGRDETGTPWVIGCADVGTIEDTMSVTMEAHPVTQVEVLSSPNVAFIPGADAPRPVRVAVTDRFGNPMMGVDVKWQRSATTTETEMVEMGQTVTTTAGEAVIDVPRPEAPGPFGLDVDVRWAEASSRVSGFLAPERAERFLDGPLIDYAVGRVGPTGERGVAALVAGDGPNEARVQLIYPAVFGGMEMTLSPMMTNLGTHIVLLDRPNETRDQVLVIGNDTWNDVAGDGALESIPTTVPEELATLPIQRVFPFGGCEGANPGVLVSYVLGPNILYDLEGMLTAEYRPLFDFLVSGCVSNQRGEARQSLLIQDPEFGLLLTYHVEDDFELTQWVALPSGVSFTRRFNNGLHYVLATQVEVNDVVISHATWEETPNGPRLQVEGIDDPPVFPLANRGGDLDGDGLLDIVSLFRTDPMADYGVWVVSSQAQRDTRISGSFERNGPPWAAPALEIVDLNGDDMDDILLIEQGVAEGQSASRVEVYFMGSGS